MNKILGELGSSKPPTFCNKAQNVKFPLPIAFSEHLAQISNEQSGERLRAFLDIFHHRMFSLLYRAWKKSRPVISKKIDPLFRRVLSLIGHSEKLASKPIPDLSEVRMQVLRARTADGLEQFLGHRLGYPCGIEQLQKRVIKLPVEQRTAIGQHHCELGRTTLVGACMHDYNKICIAVQADSFEMFEKLIPAGVDSQEIDQVLGGYLHEPMDYDLEVTLPAEKIPQWSLGQFGSLGQSAWLGVPKQDAICRWQANDGEENATA